MAPELLSEGSNASKEADMYAFGMVVYEVITGARPFGNRRQVELPSLTLLGVRPSRPEDPTAVGFSQGTWEFAERCWDGNPGRRPSSRETLEHFERVAMVSTDVDPGPTIKVHETPYPESENSSFYLVSTTSSCVGLPVWYGCNSSGHFICDCLARRERVSLLNLE